MFALALLLVLATPNPSAANFGDDAPKVVSLDPENGATDVDAKKVAKLVVTFDRPMSDAGWSFCGGGPNYPTFKGKPRWESSKKIVVEVELEPDHEYKLSLNCPAATDFESAKGVALAPVPWSFKTAPGKGAAPEGPPKIISLEPENGAVDVDAKKTTKLVVVFDRPMNDRGWSLCGGGPNYPSFKGSPRWDTPTKLVVDIELEANHEYALNLNCPAAQNFRSQKGVPLVPTPWSFSTASDKLPNQATQKAENKKSFEALQALLASSYSHYDLRVRNWERLYRENEPAILGAKTTRGWATAVAKMLAATEDIHMYLRLGDRVFATGSRAVDPLYRRELLKQYVEVQPAGDKGLAGRTSDGIGYVMISAWENPAAISAIEQALGGLRDCKAVVVDVRPNCGGDELLAQRVAAWFVDGAKVYGKNRYREKPGPDGFGPVLERTLNGNTGDKRITSPIVVLTCRYVMSSNESFVLMLRQAKDCTVVGERTYGSSGNPKPHELPNGVTIVVPSWQDMSPDGTCFEGVGLTPDVEVAATARDLETKDPILERALSLVRDKIKQ